MATRAPPCEHFDGLASLAPRSTTCEACAALGTRWNELRVCLSCGHVGCCEDSPNAHALAHFHETGHPVIAALDRGQHWAWCYAHSRYYDLPEALRPAMRSGVTKLIARLRGR
jgi:hypothetical protein